jgi:hypothetical protein
MVYDASIKRCYAENMKNMDSYRMLIMFEASFEIDIGSEIIRKYYSPSPKPMTNKEVLDFINGEMDQNTIERYDFQKFQRGEISPVKQFAKEELLLKIFGPDDEDDGGNDSEDADGFGSNDEDYGGNDDGLEDAEGTKVCVYVCLIIYCSTL